MRRLYSSATVIFWLLVSAIWSGTFWQRHEEKNVLVLTDQTISAAELAKHARPENCWMAIRGNVYDLTAYLPEHPSHPGLIQSWCGKESTQAYNTKTKGHQHSGYADELLAEYRIGTFNPAQR